METIVYPIHLEQIRKIKKGSTLFKASELENVSTLIDGEWQESGMFLIQGIVPDENHYLIIDRPSTNMLNNETFFVVYMITHSPQYNNILIQKEWVQNFDLHVNSHVTTNTFLIREQDIIMDKQYGAFDLETFKKHIEVTY